MKKLEKPTITSLPNFDLSNADDQTLEKMKKKLKEQFEQHSYCCDESESTACSTAAIGFATVLGEQRERALLRAKLKK